MSIKMVAILSRGGVWCGGGSGGGGGEWVKFPDLPVTTTPTLLKRVNSNNTNLVANCNTICLTAHKLPWSSIKRLRYPILCKALAAV